MCLELMSKLYLLYYIMTMRMVRPQGFYSSPCPDTFRYQTDQNGQLYGLIGVTSFNKEVVRLSVQFTLTNRVNQGYNGHIELINPRHEVLDNIKRERPIKYKLFFPSWQDTPPRITKIVVNGQVVCTGSPSPTDEWARLLTTVTLQHRIGVTTELSPFIPNDNDRPNNNNVPKNPFFEGGPKRGNNNNNNNGFFSGTDGFNLADYEEIVNFYPKITTQRTTTIRSRRPVADNDLSLSENPFLNGRVTPPLRPPTASTGEPRVPPPRKTPSSSIPSSDVCGRSVVANQLVVNGDAVPLGAFPWLTAMYLTTGVGVEYKCCGTLISQKHVVTAAHCVHKKGKKVAPDQLLLILGKLNLQKLAPTPGEKFVEAVKIEVHPQYVKDVSDADIAVVILNERLEFTKTIKPICLWAESDDLDAVVGQTGKVVGWGKDESNNLMTHEPKQVNLPIVSQEVCLRASEAFEVITSNRTFCAGERNNKGPCNGDSGSGFIMKRNDRWFLRGVVSISTYDSFKQSCDLTNYVAFTDVSKFKPWLLSIIDVR